MEKSVAVIGDLMLDKSTHYKTGERVNPENKLIPLVSKKTEKEEYRLGGAGNLAANIQSLLGNVLLYGPYNPDSAVSEKVIQACNESGMTFHGMQTSARTIIKERVYIDNKNIYRIDDEEPISISTNEKKRIVDILMSERPSHIIISDYAKGTIDAELVALIQAGAQEIGAPILVDTKPKNAKMFGGVFLLKPNFKEFREMIGKDIANEDKEIEFEGMQFVQKYHTNLVVTRSEKGATLITHEGAIHHLPTHAHEKDLVDVTGAGDTFLAGLTVGLIQGLPLQKAVELGNKASGIAVKQMGTSVITAEQLQQ